MCYTIKVKGAVLLYLLVLSVSQLGCISVFVPLPPLAKEAAPPKKGTLPLANLTCLVSSPLSVTGIDVRT